MTAERLEWVVRSASKADSDEIRDFLKRKVGRRLIAILLGGTHMPNLRRADAYLYRMVRLEDCEMRKIEECYLAARIIDEVRHCEKDVDGMVARNWLMMSCFHLEDHAPICAIRDGRTYNHLSAIGAAKTFVLNR